MSKILDRLHLIAGTSLVGEQVTTAEAEIPFIEVGPNRHVEGSADVMAIAPSAQKPPSPHSVQLRPLTQKSGPGRGRMAAELIAFHAPDQPVSARYAEMLPGLLEAAKQRAGEACRTILFTSSRNEVGQTTMLLNLAITAARQSRRVVVVDANFRRPGIAARLGLEAGPGLAEVLAGDCAIIEALQATAQNGLSALTAGNSLTVFTDQTELRGVIELLAEQHDLVLVDAPRWDGRMVAVLAGLCQVVFLTAPAAEADTPPASELVRELPAKGIALAGCILIGS